MKKVILVIMALLALLPLAQASGIVGKWYCSKVFFDSLGVGIYYPNIDGFYDFKEDGTFAVKINGELQTARPGEYYGTLRTRKAPRWMRTSPAYQTLLIEVKGKYRIDGNAITTAVDSDDVHVYINTGLTYPADRGAWASKAEAFWKEVDRRSYRVYEDHALIHKNTIKTEKMPVWRWEAKPLSISSDSVRVGTKFLFYKSRKSAKLTIIEVNDSIHLDCRRIVSMETHWAKEKVKSKKSSVKERLRAIETLKETLKYDSCAVWAYYIGAAYADGRMGQVDSAQALFYLGKAARVGYGKAYTTLGMMYKEERGGVRQDFKTAYHYFCKGVECQKQDKDCMYYKGYMLTKGLGCKQSYEDAVQAFLPAANWPDAKSLYMIGVFLRNGYGLVKDLPLASNSLKRAARMHCKEAKEELARPHEETYMHETYLDDERYSFIPDTMPDVRPSATDGILADGSYSGFIVTYDWSGKYILDEQPLSMTVGRADGELSGTLTVGRGEVPYRGTLSGGRLVFSDGNVTLPERYVRGGKMDYELASMALDATDGKIRGRLNLYSAKLKEPGWPMYIELDKCE